VDEETGSPRTPRARGHGERAEVKRERGGGGCSRGDKKWVRGSNTRCCCNKKGEGGTARGGGKRRGSDHKGGETWNPHVDQYAKGGEEKGRREPFPVDTERKNESGKIKMKRQGTQGSGCKEGEAGSVRFAHKKVE